jgi:hypothetical protein
LNGIGGLSRTTRRATQPPFFEEATKMAERVVEVSADVQPALAEMTERSGTRPDP